MPDARGVFDGMARRDVVSWTALISGYVENRDIDRACESYDQMEGCEPDARAFLAVLTAYARLAAQEEGVQVCGKLAKVEALGKSMALHDQIFGRGCDKDIFVASSLVDLYAKCGSLLDARIVFDRMAEHNVVSWTSLVMGYVENGGAGIALQLFSCFHSTGLVVNSRVMVAALMACGSLATKEEGTQVCGRLVKIGCLEQGVVLYEQAKSRQLDSEVHVANSLIDMFAKCGSMQRARRVFETMELRNVVSWTSLIQGYVENGKEELALDLFGSMETPPNAWTFTTVLMCYASLAAKSSCGTMKTKWLEKTKALHDDAVKSGCSLDIVMANTLVFTYMKCGSMVDADQVFSSIGRVANVVSWTSMILGYTENGEHEQALEHFYRMKAAGSAPDSRAFVAALTAMGRLAEKEANELQDSAKTKCLERAVEMHLEITASGLDSDSFVANTLMEVYAKCRCMPKARQVFQGMVNRNTASWNTMILGYVKNGASEQALETFTRMKLEPRRGCEPNHQTYVAVLTALGDLSTGLEAGREIHGEICRRGLIEEPSSSSPPVLATCLLDFYAKSASMAAARHVFDSVFLGGGDAAIWNALISGYSIQGDTFQVCSSFREMRGAGIQPDEATFQSILMSCSHAGLLDEARKFFREMGSVYGIAPRMEHYSCMVDLLGRANRVEEGMELLERMPWKADTVAWTSILSAWSQTEQK
ncbi:pentatricopeptide repeat-containing protein At2g33680-like [Selaginella moellendorffii]|uniref:pentatricopeptide repeat-containing protein At2g33680-like n=1 Tax=Selaginella moellendorffii TaxID=88036 RepID=UPI000D1C23B3|nr:pentatricopeptide repeat-containing protein At2g33680-like [Selaginella moellendorffii]|eukprot:XP_024522855.1 pentatricopeptide repeat-containing protein At2g33680-like [Selaginella moellendorffii]